MSSKLFFIFFYILSFHINSSFYNYCDSANCDNGCCEYENVENLYDTSCIYLNCSCTNIENSIYCNSNSSSGYHYCQCSSGCCYYYATLNYSDPFCKSANCECMSSDYYCLYFNNDQTENSSNSTVSRAAGYHHCPGCLSECCYFSESINFLDENCNSSYCSCQNSSDKCSNISKKGYSNCSGCLSGCCYYMNTLDYLDTYCNSSECSCAASLNCQYNSSSNAGSTSLGYNFCSFSYCYSGCCYYSRSLNYSDYFCTSIYCQCVNLYSSCTNYNFLYIDEWTMAEKMSEISGKNYVVVNYPAWRAIVAIGSCLAGIWFFLNLYLIYYKCFHKPRAMNNQACQINNQKPAHPQMNSNTPIYPIQNHNAQHINPHFQNNNLFPQNNMPANNSFVNNTQNNQSLYPLNDISQNNASEINNHSFDNGVYQNDFSRNFPGQNVG